jgi:magnesium-transporting ATPase (P-type)
MRSATFCNDSKLIEPADGGKWKIIGDPTEAALLVAAKKSGFNWEEELEKNPRIFELPFDSQRKSMSSIHNDKGKQVAYVKGAPKKIIGLSNTISVDGEVKEFSEEFKNKIITKHDELAALGLRILAMAYRDLPTSYDNYRVDAVECDLTFLGMVAMQDPPRPEVKPAVDDCHRAGIRIIMITGDYGLTADAIAREVGIVSDEPCRIIKGKELNQMTDDEV